MLLSLQATLAINRAIVLDSCILECKKHRGLQTPSVVRPFQVRLVMSPIANLRSLSHGMICDILHIVENIKPKPV